MSGRSCAEAPVIAITGTNGKSTTTALDRAHPETSAGSDAADGRQHRHARC